ncbi:MAG TPA: cytochrome c-type biogenesis protein [Methylomirabilota bacterium]|jgi:cytochrome c-type biogenesis protein CcmH|nr:cytochrome c-type biogenesis protein [Methylomirabilota bacterium]
MFGRPRPLLLCALITLAVLGIALEPAAVVAEPVATAIDEQKVYEVASQLRCVVCQTLSVADSPSEMANQMRSVIRERLATGEPPAQVIQYFVDKYGDWILLEPRRQGFTLLVWLLPPLAVVVGLAVVALLVTRWTRRRSRAPAPPGVDPGMSERIRREMESEG